METFIEQAQVYSLSLSLAHTSWSAFNSLIANAPSAYQIGASLRYLFLSVFFWLLSDVLELALFVLI